MYFPAIHRFNFDIDVYINPFVPRSQLYRLPRPISTFLGYRDRPRRNIGSLVSWTWSFIGAFSGVALIEGVCRASPLIQSHAPPVVIGSFGAAAILEYNTIESPFAQPRNLVLGHFLSALVGVCITKLFALLPPARFDTLRWLAGALAVGTSSVVMSVTKTVHPPAGATALLAATSPDITRLGWYLLPLVLLGSVLMLASACLINNIHRQFPIYWWTPINLNNELHRRASTAISTVSQAEKDEETASKVDSRRLSRAKTPEEIHFDREHEMKVTSERIIIPTWLRVNDWESNVLEILRARLKEGANEGLVDWHEPAWDPERTKVSGDTSSGEEKT